MNPILQASVPHLEPITEIRFLAHLPRAELFRVLKIEDSLPGTKKIWGKPRLRMKEFDEKCVTRAEKHKRI